MFSWTSAELPPFRFCHLNSFYSSFLSIFFVCIDLILIQKLALNLLIKLVSEISVYLRGWSFFQILANLIKIYVVWLSFGSFNLWAMFRWWLLCLLLRIPWFHIWWDNLQIFLYLYQLVFFARCWFNFLHQLFNFWPLIQSKLVLIMKRLTRWDLIKMII